MTIHSRHDVQPRPGIRVFDGRDALGSAAATVVASALDLAIEQREHATLLLAAAPSQEPLLLALSDRTVDWTSVTAMHIDDYLRLPAAAPQSFANWLAERLDPLSGIIFEPMHTHDASPDAEIARYSAILAKHRPFDVSCLGIGVNGHIAFNEPGECDFDDAQSIRVIDLDLTSRQQQVQEGLYPDLEAVPTRAMTVTVPTLLNSQTCVVSVLGDSKRQAVARALDGPVSTDCPASVVQRHSNCHVFLDRAAAASLERSGVRA